MNEMNENAALLQLSDHMNSQEGWGRVQGREVYGRLIDFVESNPGVLIFRVSVKGVRRVDISFASETVVELAKRFRSRKGFCFIDLADSDMLENWEAAAERKGQPFMVWRESKAQVIGPNPTQGTAAAFDFAAKRESTRASEFVAANPGVTISNASMKFKQLWEQGFLLRREDNAESGGVEYVYFRIK